MKSFLERVDQLSTPNFATIFSKTSTSRKERKKRVNQISLLVAQNYEVFFIFVYSFLRHYSFRVKSLICWKMPLSQSIVCQQKIWQKEESTL